jgi:hypothetical protein
LQLAHEGHYQKPVVLAHQLSRGSGYVHNPVALTRISNLSLGRRYGGPLFLKSQIDRRSISARQWQPFYAGGQHLVLAGDIEKLRAHCRIFYGFGFSPDCHRLPAVLSYARSPR